MLSLYLKAVSLIAPGIADWNEAKQIFTQKKPYSAVKVDKKLSTMLPPNENRRCSRTTQLALSSIQQLLSQPVFKQDPIDSQTLCYVFSSCNGDLNVFHHISTALSQEGRPVSPIKFHNSVHNAPAGYAAIVLKSNAPSTSISAYKDSFSNGLLEAAVQSSTSKQACLFTAYDELPPEPLLSLFPIEDDFACSLFLAPELSTPGAICRMDISITHDQPLTMMENEQFEHLRNVNPQAKIVPLLYAIAKQQKTTLYFNDNQQQIALTLSEFSGDSV
jgi:hypothetical protein